MNNSQRVLFYFLFIIYYLLLFIIYYLLFIIYYLLFIETDYNTLLSRVESLSEEIIGICQDKIIGIGYNKIIVIKG